MARVKCVVLGGSGVATPELVNALLEIPERKLPIDLVLVGRSEDKLATVAQICKLLVGESSSLSISYTTDVQSAFSGAEFVLNQIRVGGLKARAFDESFPHDLGLPGEETVGPGGFANASRTVPVVLEYARLIEKICPDATLLTFANPSSLVQYAITHYTRVQVIGLCDGPVTLKENLARVLSAPVEEIVIDYVGMHHFGWVVGVWWKGKDLLPEALNRAAEVAPEVDPAITQAIGAIPGHYLNYLFHPDRMLAKKMGKRTRAEELLELEDVLLLEYKNALSRGEKPAGLERRKARWYKAIIAPVMIALIEKNRAQFILNVINGNTIPWLPSDAIVEVTSLVEGGRIRPLAVPSVPPEVRTLVQANCTYEMQAVEAIVERNRAKALRALLINPIIQTYNQAAMTLERSWNEIM